MKYYALIISYFIFSGAYGQKCTSEFSGKVEDFHDATAIVGATLYIETLNIYTTTDLDGNFSFKDLCDGKITVTISHAGCETKQADIIIKGNTSFEFNLEHHIEALNEVTIHGSLDRKLTKTSQETLLKIKDLENYSASSLGDALKQVSGVSSLNTGSNIVKPIINGLHSSRVVVITNGVRLHDQEWGVEHAPNIDINTSGSISVIKGSGALAFSGDAIGGIVILNPNHVILKDSLYGKTIMSGHTNGKGYSFTSILTKTWDKGWYISGQVSNKRFGDFKAANYNLTNTGLRSLGFSVNGGYKTFEKGFNINYSYLNNKIGILRAAHIGSARNLVDAINNKVPFTVDPFSYNINAPKQDVTHQIIKAEFYKRFKQFGKLKIQYDFQNNQRFEFDVRRGDRRNKPALDLNLKTHSIRSELKLDSNTNTIYNFGFNLGYQNNFANPDTGIRRLIPDYDKYDLGIFAITNLKLKENTILDIGIRYDFSRIDAKKFYLKSRWEERQYNIDFSNIIIDDIGIQYLTNPVFNFHNVSASAGIAHHINNKNTLVFNYSLSQRAPNPSELFSDGLHHSAARIELGDLRIGQEISNRFAATYKFLKPNFSVNVESFINHIHDFIQIIPKGTENTIRGAFPVWDYVQTNALLMGIDLSANYNFNKQWTITNKSSLIKGKDLKAETPLIDIPAFKTVNVLGYNNKKWLGLHAELESELALRQNEYPNFNFDTFIASTQENVEVDISSPPPAYHLLHFRSDITLPISKKTNLNIGATVFNIFNVSYREYLNRLRYFADDLGRNVMVQIKFNY